MEILWETLDTFASENIYISRYKIILKDKMRKMICNVYDNCDYPKIGKEFS